MKTVRDLLASLLLAASCFHATTDGQRTCTQLDKPVYFIFGHELYPRTSDLTATQCRDLCFNNSACVAYQHDELHRSNVTDLYCFTYSAIGLPYSKVTVDPLATAGRCGTLLPQVNGDIIGNDLKNVKASDAVQCSYACESTTGCNAYSWTNYNGGTCWMKTELTPNFVGPSDGSVISGEVFRCGIQGPDSDFHGEDMGSVKRTKWRDCCGVCRRTKGCILSAWSNYNGGTCWLKKTRSNAFTSEGVMSMYLS